MIEIDTIKTDILRECKEDYVGLWEIVSEVRSHLPRADENEIRDYAMSVLDDLLTTRKIVAGHPSQDGKVFVAWNLSSSAAVCRIRNEWKQLSGQPRLGDIVWFDISPLSTVQ